MGTAPEWSIAGPIEFDRSWIFAKTGVPWYELSGSYRAEESRPLITILSSHARGQPVGAVRGSYGETSIQVKNANGVELEFVKSDAGWKVDGGS